MTQLNRSRRSFLKASVALAGTTPLIAGVLKAQSNAARGSLMAYVGTFSSPLGDVLPTQVDLPPGRFLYCCNQRADNIAVFRVNWKTGGLQFTGHYAPVGNPSIIVFPVAMP